MRCAVSVRNVVVGGVVVGLIKSLSICDRTAFISKFHVLLEIPHQSKVCSTPPLVQSNLHLHVVVRGVVDNVSSFSTFAGNARNRSAKRADKKIAIDRLTHLEKKSVSIQRVRRPAGKGSGVALTFVDGDVVDREKGVPVGVWS